tara:strand:+ start:1982 stop:3031 length:1050 start_codon:yes stop_codon:yes gene_type:complete
MLKAEIYYHNLKFLVPGGTSRGILHNKPTWYIKIFHSNNTNLYGMGECGPINGLSLDDYKEIPYKLKEVVKNINDISKIDLSQFPSIQFAYENALKDFYNGGERVIFKNTFIKGRPIKINGLIWMGNKEFMLKQITQKLEEGFSCLKLKIGAIKFEEEISVIKSIRSKFSSDYLEIRVDANGAFKTKDIFEKLEQLADLNIHSIEQPIAINQWKEMKEICHLSPIPIVLDEELISIRNNKEELLELLKPQYLVLKPTLIGGFKKTDEWIKLATKKNIKWWITSALESNLGLNAIAQFCSEYKLDLPQGLGTGKLFSNNISSPLSLNGEKLYYDINKNWDLSTLKNNAGN